MGTTPSFESTVPKRSIRQLCIPLILLWSTLLLHKRPLLPLLIPGLVLTCMHVPTLLIAVLPAALHSFFFFFLNRTAVLQYMCAR